MARTREEKAEARKDWNGVKVWKGEEEKKRKSEERRGNSRRGWKGE